MLEYVKLAFKFIYDRPTRKRLWGFRPVVICLIQGVGDKDKFLFICPAAKPTAWMAPQEGIEPDESLENAVHRGLKAELGIPENQLQFRRSCWLGDKKIPEQRGERDVKNSLVKMRGKAYYAALVKVSTEADITNNPAEVAKFKWLTIDEIEKNLPTNSGRKQGLTKLMFSKLLKIDLTELQTTVSNGSEVDEDSQ